MALITDPVVTVAQAVREFRRGAETVLALDRVSLRLYGGELTVAAGPSGSGKTTLLSVIAGTEQLDAGSVHTHHPLPAGVAPADLRWHELAFIPQTPALLDELTVAENVELPARLAGASTEDRWDTTADLLATLEIAHLADRYPSHTSGGEQQRTAVARALRLRPSVLLGDEPTGHQDRGRIDLMLTVLRQHAYRGAVVLLTSHDPEVIAAADRIITLADGRIASDVRTEAVRYG